MLTTPIRSVAAVPAIAVLLATTAAHAGTGLHYRFTVRHEVFANSESSGQAWIDGPRYRVELAPLGDGDDARAYDVGFSADGGKTETRLHHGLRTWFTSQRESGRRGGAGSMAAPPRPYASGITSRLFRLLPGAELAATPTVDFREEENAGAPAAATVKKYVLQLSYPLAAKMGKEVARSQVTATVMIWTDEAFEPPALTAFRFRTGIAELDDALAPIERIPGLVVKQSLAVHHTDEFGRRHTELVTCELDDIEAIELPAALFERPKGYRLHEPEFAAPGVTSTVPIGK